MRRVCLLLLVLAAQGCSSKADRPTKGGMRAESASVLVAQVTKKDVPIEIQAVGTVEASATVTVKSQVSGELTQVLFREGDFVKKGDELFKVDSRTYEAQLNQIQANLAKDEATLAQLEANLARDVAQQKYAQAEAGRNMSLYEKRLVSKEQAEQSSAGAEAASAVVRADQAAILSARASIEATKAGIANARVSLSYTSIRSSLSGRTGDILIQQGNLVGPSTNLTIINQVEPIYVGFSIPQNQLSSVKKGQPVVINKQDGSSATEKGKLFFIDNAVDPATGTILVKAAITNKAHTLWPGEFVRVVLRLGMKQDALIVPSQAVQSGQSGPFVFVVKSDQKVESRPVVPGMRVDTDIVIEKGLTPGETIVTEGQLRLVPSTPVKIR
jgi:membrane fusion protein, multidrug efflux system